MGKSETALAVAKAFNGEIINGDAFQSYKEMDIGTAKPSKDLMAQVPHHLYSCVDPDHEYSIAEYQKNLRAKVDELLKANKNIIIVGGSGLYIKSALYDFEFKEEPAVDLSEYEKLDNHALHDKLAQIDKKQANLIHENNRKRVLRAIAIYLAQGKTKSEVIDAQEHKLLYEAKFFVREMDREVLYELINKRVDEMVKTGLVEEVKALVSKYGKECKSFQAIGYKELIKHFNGETTLDEAIEEIKKNSRNYAKRQVTYIKHQFPVTFYKNTEDLLRILGKWKTF